MRFNTTVEGARWDDDAHVWRIALAGGETLSAQFLIAATGFLCQPKTPDIPGIETFGGRIIHTAAWDDSYSLTQRRAAVIGTGSTGVQVVPELAKEVAELTVYQRTPIWVMPKLDVPFPPVVQRLFARLPLTQRIVRWFTDVSLEFMMVITMWNYRRFRLTQQSHIGCVTDVSVDVGARQGAVPHPEPGFRLRLQAADNLELVLPCVHQAACASGNQWHRADRARRHRRARRHQTLHRHPGPCDRFRRVGRQPTGDRGDRPGGPEPWKVVARDEVPGLRRCFGTGTSPTS